MTATPAPDGRLGDIAVAVLLVTALPQWLLFVWQVGFRG